MDGNLSESVPVVQPERLSKIGVILGDIKGKAGEGPSTICTEDEEIEDEIEIAD